MAAGAPEAGVDGDSDVPIAIAVTSPDLVLPAPDGPAPTAAVLQPPEAQPLETAVAQASVLLDQCGHLVVVHSDALPAAYVRRLHTVRAVLESERIALLPVALPPLAVGVLARQLRQLSLSDLGPGVLASATRLLAHYIYAGAQLASVARFDRVPVGLGPHLTSLLPGVRFGVLVNPAPRLVRPGGDGVPGPAYPTRLTVAREGPRRAEDWVTDVLAPEWRVEGVQEVSPLPAESVHWWGTRRAVEFAAAIPDPSILYQLISSVRREECRWCGLELIGDRCGFCAAGGEAVA
ncbi:hypothetical protein J7W19_20565 [Streptomyces mobaraensis NBRC 13819 = DSM 40847]|uniref:Uncharacterized protein n=2 Tax=Streptomyces mobaraensis TaxID=35621 RepID=A0A5N5WHC1_STRMB|nr:hypothetical protein H340_19013 [Streptomyces mobaraensis NBRC 13819 = DSM 40847]KAB7852526.1 hypothetical protein FRZ00_01725 [Streptomyces mobaraensis]QTT75448.1 hypothetical protein J7W19_20565 [Streptomyces mobaraensis NBRC 13819 = DSM 40847]